MQGPRQQVLAYPRYIINGCRYHIKDCDEARVNQNSGISIMALTMQIASPKDKNPVLGYMCFYAIVTEIWDLDYNMFNICVFKYDWIDNKNGVKVDELGFTLVDLTKIRHKLDPFILATQAQQVFYVEDQVDPRWSIVLSRQKMELFNIEGDDNMTDNCMGCLILSNLMKLKIMIKFVCVLIVRGFGLNIKSLFFLFFLFVLCDY